MPLQIVRDDITKLKVNAIVNSANHTPPEKKPHGTDGAIHAAAGDELLTARKNIGDIAFGDAKWTPAFNLGENNVDYLIHTVAPIWHGGNMNEVETLRSCYKNSLTLALELNCSSIAFSAMGTGINNFPRNEALKIAISEITGFLFEHEEANMEVTLVIFDRETFELCKKVFPDIKENIDDSSVEELANLEYEGDLDSKRKRQSTIFPAEPLGKTFNERLNELIEAKNLNLADVCWDARVSPRVRSDINTKGKEYHPLKETAIRLALAMELNLEETQSLLKSAFYTLHANNRYDSAIIGFILKKEYRLRIINEELRRQELPQF